MYTGATTHPLAAVYSSDAPYSGLTYESLVVDWLADVAATRHLFECNKRYEATGKTAVQILFDDVAPKFKDVNGGYTTILKTYNRKGDNAPMAILSLTK